MEKNRQAGFDACIDGVLQSQNPHKRETLPHREWEAGWTEAAAIREEWEEANHAACRA